MVRTPEQLAEQIRHTLIEAAKEAYEDAGLSGLCAEGRWENALGAMQTCNLKPVLANEHKP